MDISKKENKFINIVKYGAICAIFILSFLITKIYISQQNTNLENDITQIEEDYKRHNKTMIKGLVNKVHNLIDLEQKYERIDFRNELKEEIHQAYSIVSQIYNNNINKPDYSEEKTLDLIKDALRNFKFHSPNGYFFIFEMTGKVILNKQLPYLEGTNLWNYKDSQGILIVQEMNKILQKKDETSYSWYWKKNPKDETEEKKIGYFKKFEPYDFFIGTGYYESNFKKLMQERILKKLNSLTFEEPEHIFIYDMEGNSLVNPNKELLGTNRINYQNKHGRYIVKDLLEFTKENKEGFQEYFSPLHINDTLKSNQKISFLKLYNDWNWMIGSGFYLEKLHNKIERKKNDLILSNNKAIEEISIFSITITVIMIIISFYLSNMLRKSFVNYRSQLEKEVKKTIEKEKLLIHQSKMATMGEMIGSITHQWKQPLSLLSMSNGLIKLSRENKELFNDKEIDDSIKNIDYAMNDINNTIDNFRNFFNPNKKKAPFLVSDAFNETFKLISSQFKNKDIEIIKNINSVTLYACQNELQQTLINLLKNAKEELVKLDSSEKKFIFIDTFEDDENIVIKIKDNAKGIPKNIIEKVFDSYFTTKEENGGSGIGLYICKQIIEGNMKGSIIVENKDFLYENVKYKGAEFTILLPLKLKYNK